MPTPEPSPVRWIAPKPGVRPRAAYVISDEGNIGTPSKRRRRCLVQWIDSDVVEYVEVDDNDRNTQAEKRPPSLQEEVYDLTDSPKTCCSPRNVEHVSPGPRMRLFDGNRSPASRHATDRTNDKEDHAESGGESEENLDTRQPNSLCCSSIDPTCESVCSGADRDETEKDTAANSSEVLPVTPSPIAKKTVASLEKATGEAKIKRSNETDVGDLEEAPKTFTHRSSAYVQCLAEICHAILWDLRWRVRATDADGRPCMKRLCSWEQGDDMSVVTVLSQRYDPLPSLSKDKKPPCRCLLCRDKDTNFKNLLEDSSSVIGSCTEGTRAIDEPESEGEKRLICDDINELADSPPEADVPDDVSAGDNEDRCINLYCRLYFRKGPWFRIDDIFKYYAVKTSPKKATNNSNLEDEQREEETEVKGTSSGFFTPQSKKPPRKPVDKPSSRKPQYENLVNTAMINEQLTSVETMLNDLQRLQELGYVRCFADERECGKTVGASRRYGLLKVEEQRQVLSKLGGRESKSSTRKNEEQGSDHLGENLIWDQMRQQRSIFASTEKANGLMPVSKHVDDCVLWNLSKTIILKSSRVDYIPTPVFRTVCGSVKDNISKLLKSHFSPFLIRDGVASTCLRLREAPLRTLRRFSRLFLCASSGPGNARGGGWRCLPNENDEDDSERRLPNEVSHIPPPGSHSWHQLSYPGSEHRFRLNSFNFTSAYKPLIVAVGDAKPNNCDDQRANGFFSIQSFQLWEKSIEIFAHVDYLIEINDLMSYNERRRARAKDALEAGENNSLADLETNNSPFDFLGLLTEEGRKTFLSKHLSPIKNFPSDFTRSSLFRSLIGSVERDVDLMINDFGDKPIFQNDREKTLAVFGVMCVHLIVVRNHQTCEQELRLMESRPWLRHLWWDARLAYCLWQIVKILERRGCHEYASKAICVILTGKLPTADQYGCFTSIQNPSPYSSCYISRRTRGKAIDRLIVDSIHVFRKRAKLAAEAAAKESHEGTNKQSSKKGSKKKRSKGSKTPTASAADFVIPLCRHLVELGATTGFVSFSTIRIVAKRIKVPLALLLDGLVCFEASELGHRYAGDLLNAHQDSKVQQYSDWVPKIDEAVANAIPGEESSPGRRCSYIGFESDENPSFRKLNVENLAMEFYHSGRLPIDSDRSSVGGGWIGYHDEGGKLRALFRVLSSAPILGADWGCFNENLSENLEIESATVHLTAYQSAPFDLHVGAGVIGHTERVTVYQKGFYERRKQSIEKFLDRLCNLESQALCDVVYDCIATRFEYAVLSQHSDPMLEKDIRQARTLSLLAAGFGGKHLANAFRCLLFDYRHYSGGLPDLTLVRATFVESIRKEQNPIELVDLGEWVGECFSAEHRASEETKQHAIMLEDGDEEFLGCEKVEEARGRRRNGSRHSTQLTHADPDGDESNPSGVNGALVMPERLILSHHGRRIKVECMQIEVKSENDRLDPRQEDWLNVLDLNGNARVCKFAKPKTKNSKRGKKDEP